MSYYRMINQVLDLCLTTSWNAWLNRNIGTNMMFSLIYISRLKFCLNLQVEKASLNG